MIEYEMRKYIKNGQGGNNIAMIAAMAKNRVIGREGKIPWDLPEDREHFKKLTMGHVIIMGRRTYEEIGRPLPGRITCVISSRWKGEEKNCRTAKSLTDAIAQARETYPQKKIFLCGGERIYNEGMTLAGEIYLTVLKEEVEGDTYFPQLGEEWRLDKGGTEYGK